MRLPPLRSFSSDQCIRVKRCFQVSKSRPKIPHYVGLYLLICLREKKEPRNSNFSCFEFVVENILLKVGATKHWRRRDKSLV